MAKSLTASKQVMKNYLSELLTEEKPVLEKKVDPRLERLFENIPTEPVVEVPKTIKKTYRPAEIEQSTETTEPAIVEQTDTEDKTYRQGAFQAMFFKVAELTIAVPLIELGGIHNTDKTTALMGKPNWFKGVMIHRDEKINVVDTALWVMPEKCDDALLNELHYQFVIMLGESQWGLMAETLVDTITLDQDDVKWLDGSNKRPWLAGLVKERKCALLDVSSMIQLLSEGANITK